MLRSGKNQTPATNNPQDPPPRQIHSSGWKSESHTQTSRERMGLMNVCHQLPPLAPIDPIASVFVLFRFVFFFCWLGEGGDFIFGLLPPPGPAAWGFVWSPLVTSQRSLNGFISEPKGGWMDEWVDCKHDGQTSSPWWSPLRLLACNKQPLCLLCCV